MFDRVQVRDEEVNFFAMRLFLLPSMSTTSPVVALSLSHNATGMLLDRQRARSRLF